MSGLEGVELIRVRLALAEPWVTPLGTIRERRVILVRAVVDGVDGWGECVAQPDPTYTSEYEDGAWEVLQGHLVPRLLAAAPARGEGVAVALGAVKGHPMAKAALEAAVLDAELRLLGVPLVERLAAASDAPGPPRRTVPAGVAVGVLGDVGHLLAEVGRRIDEGYRRVKLKIKPGWDIRPVAAVREAFGADLALQVDANGSYTSLDPVATASALAALDGSGLLLIEQPLGDDDLVGHARLATELVTPLCLDEAIGSEAAAASALALRACRVINLKPGRVGGLYEAVRIHDRCARVGVPVWCGGMLETGIGRAANLALATLGNFSLPGDLSAADRYWEADIVQPVASLRADGTIAVPDGPGIGVSVSLPLRAVTDRVWLPARGSPRGSGRRPRAQGAPRRAGPG